MLDIKFIRQNTEIVRDAVKNKNVDLDLDKLLAADERRRHVMQEFEQLKAEQNRKSKGPQSKESIEELRGLKEKIKLLEKELEVVEGEFNNLMLQVPNIPSEDTPVGTNESQNKVVKEVGKVPVFDFQPRSHWEMALELGLIDKERAAKVAGARFAYIKGALARMQFAIIQFTIDQLSDKKVIKKIASKNKLEVSDKPFVLILPPAMIRTEIYKATARLNQQETTY